MSKATTTQKTTKPARWRGVVTITRAPRRRDGKATLQITRRSSRPTFGAMLSALARALDTHLDDCEIHLSRTSTPNAIIVRVHADSISTHPIAREYNPMDGFQALRYMRAYRAVKARTARCATACLDDVPARSTASLLAAGWPATRHSNIPMAEQAYWRGGLCRLAETPIV